MSQAGAEHSISKRDVVLFACKYWRRLALAFFIPLIVGGSVALVITPRYHAETVLTVRLGAEYVYNPEVSDGRDGSNNIIPFNQNQMFKPEVAILSSDDLHADVVKDVGIDTLFPDMDGVLHPIGEATDDFFAWIGLTKKTTPEEKEHARLARAVAQFDKRFDILLDKDSSVITVTFAHKDPALATRTLDRLLALYMEKRRTVYLAPRTKLAHEEMETSRTHADEAAQKLQQFKRQHHIYSLADERTQLLQRRSGALEQASLVTSPSLDARIADYDRQLEKLDAWEKEYGLLQKEQDIANDAYALYSRKYDEAVALENIGRQRLDSVRVIESPVAPAEPAHTRLFVMLGSAFLAVVSLFCTVSFTHALRNSFLTPDEVEESTELKVIGTFSESAESEHENMQRLLDNLHAAGSKTARIMTFISARPGEGTSHVAWNYALKLAEETGRRVLLVDAGKVSPQRTREYGYIPGNGIIDAYVDNKPVEETIREIGKGLSVCRFIRAEKYHARAGEIIADADFWKGLAEVASTIIIDASPLQLSYDGILLAAKSDAAVVVVEAEKTPPEAVRNLCTRLRMVKAKIAGVVLNRRRYHIPEPIYRRL